MMEGRAALSPEPERHARDVAAIVDGWCHADLGYAFLTADSDVIEATRGIRALIVEALLASPGSADRDLLHGFAALGRMMAERNASPTLVTSSVDGLREALAVAAAGPRDLSSSAYVVPGRAAMVESYVHVRTTTIQEDAVRAWEYPACAVPLEDGSLAVAAGHPDGDLDALAGWASRVAQAATLSGARRVVASGTEAALGALEEALDVAGIELRRRPTARGAKVRPTKPL